MTEMGGFQVRPGMTEEYEKPHEKRGLPCGSIYKDYTTNFL